MGLGLAAPAERVDRPGLAHVHPSTDAERQHGQDDQRKCDNQRNEADCEVDAHHEGEHGEGHHGHPLAEAPTAKASSTNDRGLRLGLRFGLRLGLRFGFGTGSGSGTVTSPQSTAPAAALAAPRATTCLRSSSSRAELAEVVDDEPLDEGDLAAPADEVDGGQATGRQARRVDRPVELLDRLDEVVPEDLVELIAREPERFVVAGPGVADVDPPGVAREGLLGQPDPAPEVGVGLAPGELVRVLDRVAVGGLELLGQVLVEALVEAVAAELHAARLAVQDEALGGPLEDGRVERPGTEVVARDVLARLDRLRGGEAEGRGDGLRQQPDLAQAGSPGRLAEGRPAGRSPARGVGQADLGRGLPVAQGGGLGGEDGEGRRDRVLGLDEGLPEERLAPAEVALGGPDRELGADAARRCRRRPRSELTAALVEDDERGIVGPPLTKTVRASPSGRSAIAAPLYDVP